jgi:hypothetical protein
MSQITPGGLMLSPGVYIFSGPGDPNSQPSVTNSGPVNAGVGSLWLRTDAPDATHALYVCTVAGTPPNASTGAGAVAGTWANK